MSGLYFEQFEVGQRFEHAVRRTVTETDNLLFSALTMNPAALHLDAEYAKGTVFGGGGIYNDGLGQVTLDHSSLVGNLAWEGGGLYNDGGPINIIDQSVISGNVATEQKAFIPHGGGGINNISSGTVTIDQSFVIGNQAAGTTGGGIYNQASLTAEPIHRSADPARSRCRRPGLRRGAGTGWGQAETTVTSVRPILTLSPFFSRWPW